MAVRSVQGARWDCHSCGSCCRLYDLGPVEPGIIEGLVERDVSAHWAPAAEAAWYEQKPGPDGKPAYFLTHRDGHCVFLQDDNRCAVHRLFGGDAKPGFCREFPYHVVEDPKGTVAVVRPTCAGWHASHLDGGRVEDQLSAVVSLPRAMPVRRFAPNAVAVLPDVAVSLDDWMYLEDRFLGVLAEPGLPADVNRRLRDAMFASLKRSPPQPLPVRADEAARALLGGLTQMLAPAIKDKSADPARVAFARRAFDLVATPRAPVTPSAETAAYLQLILKTTILGKSFANYGGLSSALGAWLLVGRVLPSADLAGSHEAITTWHKLMDNPATLATLRRAKPALDAVFLHTP